MHPTPFKKHNIKSALNFATAADLLVVMPI